MSVLGRMGGPDVPANFRDSTLPPMPPSSLHPAMVRELMRASHISRDFGTRAVAFVERGTTKGDIVRDIEVFANRHRLARGNYSADRPGFEGAIAAVNVALLTGEIEPSEQVKRFMEVRLTIDYGASHELNVLGDLPDAMTKMVRSAMWHGYEALRAQIGVEAASERVISLDQVLRHVEVCGGEAHYLFDWLNVMRPTNPVSIPVHWLQDPLLSGS